MSKLIGLLFLLVFLFSCSESLKPTKKEKLVSDLETIETLTKQWNSYLNDKNLEGLNSLYANEVNHYGASITKENHIRSKATFFQKYSDFKQHITGDLKIEKNSSTLYTVTFPKSSTFNGKTISVEGILIFEKHNKNWLIQTESDEISVRSQTETKEEKTFDSCLDVVMEILITSPSYKKKTAGLNDAVIKNGGFSFGITLEGSPNPEKDEALGLSDTYDFNIHESYSDRMPVIARYTFSPSKQQLYKFDEVEAELQAIEFDQSLLKEFNRICK